MPGEWNTFIVIRELGIRAATIFTHADRTANRIRPTTIGASNAGCGMRDAGSAIRDALRDYSCSAGGVATVPGVGLRGITPRTRGGGVGNDGTGIGRG